MGKFKANKERPTVSHIAPLPVDVLVAILRQCKQLPVCMPQRPEEAANWWIKMQKPMATDERPHLMQTINDGSRWITPYIDRIAFNLRRFLRLKTPDQKFIIGATEDGVWWNGDDMEFFSMVIEETMTMAEEGRGPYITRCLQKMRSVGNNLLVDDN